MRVFVTGAAGLLGTELCLQLRVLGHSVQGVDNLSRYSLLGESGPRDMHANVRALNDAGVDFRISDFRAGWSGSVDAVVHAAAQVCHSRKWEHDNPFDDLHINVVGTVALLDEARRARIPFLFISSSKVYGEKLNDQVLANENTPLGDQTHVTFFGASKASADLFAQMYGKKYGFPVGVFRPGCFTGKYALATEAQNWLPWLVHCARKGKTFNVFGDGRQVRDLLHVSDLARACIEWLDKPCSGVWNLGGGPSRAESLNSSIERVRNMTGWSVLTEHFPPRLGDVRRLVLSNVKFETDYPKWRQQYTLETIFEEALK